MAKQRRSAAPTLGNAIAQAAAPAAQAPVAAAPTQSTLYVVGKVPKVRTTWSTGQKSGTVQAWELVAATLHKGPADLNTLNGLFSGQDVSKQYPRYFARRGWLVPAA